MTIQRTTPREWIQGDTISEVGCRFKSIHIIVNWNRRSVLDRVYKQTAFQPRAKGGFIMVQLTLVGVDATALHDDL